MGEIATFVQRTALALLLSLLPWAAPLESPTLLPGTETEVLLRYGIPLLAYVIAASWLLSQRTVEGVVALGALGAAAFGALYFDGQAGPLGMIVWLVSPMILATTAFLLHALVAKAWPPAPQVPFVLTAFLLGGVNFWVTRDVLFDREAMLKAVVTRDPRNERAAVQYAEVLRGEGEGRRADEVLDTCADGADAGCLCVSATIRSLDDRGSLAAARKLGEAHLPRCAHDRLLRARYAEAVAGMGETDRALALIAELRQDGRDLPETWFAEARARKWKRDLPGALMAAREAARLHRGTAASLMAAEILFENGDDAGARAELTPIFQRENKHLRAIYLLGRIAHHERSYPEARLKYERLLELSPRNIDGHAALAMLALDEGNAAEALHHAHEIELLAPEDPRPEQIRLASRIRTKKKQ